MELVLGYDMGLNPASVDLDNKIVRINADLFGQYTPEQRRMVLLHEAGHVFFDSVDDEALADRFALEVLAGREPNSLRKSVQALTDVLSACGVSADRLSAIVRSALQIDYEKFGNQAAKDLLDESEHRTANVFGVDDALIAAIIAACVALTTMAVDNIQKRGPWFQGGDNKGSAKTNYRVNLVEETTKIVCSKIVEDNCINGERYVLAMLDNKSLIYSKVHGALMQYMVDASIFTRNWADEFKFYKPENCGWVKAVVDKQLALQRKWAVYQFAKAGMSDTNSAKSGSNNSQLWFFLAAVVAVVLILWKL